MSKWEAARNAFTTRDDSEGSDAEADDQHTAALNNIVLAPLRKMIKKHGKRLDKITLDLALVEEGNSKEEKRRRELELELRDIRGGGDRMQKAIDAAPWRAPCEQTESEMRALEKRLHNVLDEQRVQLNAHAQVFQATQTTVAQLSQQQTALQAEQTDGTRRGADDLRGLNARLDAMRGELVERVSHSFNETTGHADRLGQRLQESISKLEADLATRAPIKSVTDGTAATRSELNELRAANDELRREVKSQAAKIAELVEMQSGCATTASLTASASASEQRLATLEQSFQRLEAQLREAGGLFGGGNKLEVRMGNLEARQVRLERDVRQAEQSLSQCGAELALRPLKTDMIAAIAAQELAVEACAPKEALAELQATVQGCASQSRLAAAQEELTSVTAQLNAATSAISELRDTTATKLALAQRDAEIESLRLKLEEKMGREEAARLVGTKLDRSEARSLLDASEQLAGQVVAAETAARRLRDSLSTCSHQALDARAEAKNVGERIDRLSTLCAEMDAKVVARKAELVSLTRVVRLLLGDAEMRCAIDEVEGATSAEAADVLAKQRGVGAGGNNRGSAGPMAVSGVTLHRPGGGPLTPMPAGAAAADRVWYNSSLQPRTEVLGARRRLLANARHSWVGESCLAREATSSASPPPAPTRTSVTPPTHELRSGGAGSPDADLAACS